MRLRILGSGFKEERGREGGKRGEKAGEGKRVGEHREELGACVPSACPLTPHTPGHASGGRVLPSHAGAGVGREAGAGRGGAPNDGGKAVVPFKRRSAPPVCLWLEKGPPGELGNPPKPLVNRRLG